MVNCLDRVVENHSLCVCEPLHRALANLRRILPICLFPDLFPDGLERVPAAWQFQESLGFLWGKRVEIPEADKKEMQPALRQSFRHMQKLQHEHVLKLYDDDDQRKEP